MTEFGYKRMAKIYLRRARLSTTPRQKAINLSNAHKMIIHLLDIRPNSIWLR